MQQKIEYKCEEIEELILDKKALLNSNTRQMNRTLVKLGKIKDKTTNPRARLYALEYVRCKEWVATTCDFIYKLQQKIDKLRSYSMYLDEQDIAKMALDTVEEIQLEIDEMAKFEALSAMKKLDSVIKEINQGGDDGEDDNSKGLISEREMEIQQLLLPTLPEAPNLPVMIRDTEEKEESDVVVVGEKQKPIAAAIATATTTTTAEGILEKKKPVELEPPVPVPVEQTTTVPVPVEQTTTVPVEKKEDNKKPSEKLKSDYEMLLERFEALKNT
jgi:hypothetical protein